MAGFDVQTKIRYRRIGEGFVLYSIGSNGTDDGGRGWEEEEEEDEDSYADWDDEGIRVPADILKTTP